MESIHKAINPHRKNMLDKKWGMGMEEEEEMERERKGLKFSNNDLV